MLVTRAVLEKLNACSEGREWFLKQNILEHEPGILNLLKEGHPEWANWLMVRLLLNKRQRVLYACFAAKQVLSIFEKKFPNDKRPRKAIEAALKWVKHPTAADAAYAAYAANAANAAYAAANAANAADAAYAANAAYAAYAANAAYAAAYAANAANAAYAAAYAANAAKKKQLQLKIVKYGFKLIRERTYA